MRSYRIVGPTFGSFHVYGEVENTTATPAYFVQVIGKFLNADGGLVATNNTYTFLTKTEAGGRNPFDLLLSNAPAGVDHVDLSATYSVTSILNYNSVEIFSQQTRDNFGLEVFGEIHNNQGHEMRSVEVAATWYDAVGNVYYTDFGFPDVSPLSSDAFSTYKISTFQNDLAGLNYTLQAQGYLAP